MKRLWIIFGLFFLIQIISPSISNGQRLKFNLIDFNNNAKIGEIYTIDSLNMGYELNTELRAFLDTLTNYLIKNPNICVRINPFSDNIGNYKENCVYEAKWAGTVSEYLKLNNITNNRMLINWTRSVSYPIPKLSEENLSKKRKLEFNLFEVTKGKF